MNFSAFLFFCTVNAFNFISMLRDVFIVKDGNITTESCKRCGGSGCGQCAVDYDYHSCTYCSCHGDAQRIQYYHDTCGGCGQNPGPWTCTCFSPWTSGDCSIGPPTVIPTRSPSLYPSPDPTMKPTESPTYIPSLSPTTSFPSVQPSYRPSTTTPTQTRLPSRYPTYNPRTVIYESHHPFDQVLDVMNLEVKLEGASQYEIAFDPLTDLRGFQIGFYVSDSETAGKYTPSYTGSANVTVYPGVGRPAIIITTDFFYLRVARLETKLRKDLESTSTWGFSVQVTPLMSEKSHHQSEKVSWWIITVIVAPLLVTIIGGILLVHYQRCCFHPEITAARRGAAHHIIPVADVVSSKRERTYHL